jgi:Ca-activated chloride channel family protein
MRTRYLLSSVLVLALGACHAREDAAQSESVTQPESVTAASEPEPAAAPTAVATAGEERDEAAAKETPPDDNKPGRRYGTRGPAAAASASPAPAPAKKRPASVLVPPPPPELAFKPKSTTAPTTPPVGGLGRDKGGEGDSLSEGKRKQDQKRQRRDSDKFRGADGDSSEPTDAPTADGQGLLAEAPAEMLFQHYGVNPTIDTAEEPRSTFAVDVDTASYTMARSFLDGGRMPNEAAIRVEELVNAFDYGYEAPIGKTFNVMAEAAPSPNRRGYHLLHVGVKGMEVARDNRKAANLVFVIDVSGSMAAENRLGLVKKSLTLLVGELDEGDKVGIVTYGTNAREVLQPTSAYRRAEIIEIINSLAIEGATNAEAGLTAGYQMAVRHFRDDAVNRVVLCSDGVANVGATGPQGILDTVSRELERGVTLTTVGFGMGNYNDVMMEQLADKGDGNYFYVDKLDEARRVFVDNLTGTLQVIAKDVKIQMTFDERSVVRYRLIGYENRALTAEQFNDDRVDAGEIGAGHAVTAVYEVKLREDSAAPIGTVRVRFKEPSGGQSTLVATTVPRSIVRDADGELSSPTQLSLIVAQFAEKLRGSYWARNIGYEDILSRFDMLAPALRQRADVVGLRRLVEKARDLDTRGDKFVSQGPVARMDFDRVPVLR